MRRGRESCNCYPGEEKVWGGEQGGVFTDVCKDLMEGNEEKGRLSGLPTDRARGNGHKLKHMRFHLNTGIFLL